MSEPLVVFENVVKRFGAAMAVEQLNLEIYKGEFVAIMGSSGCGKTTTLRMLAGLEQPSEGEVRLAGRRMNEVSAFERDTPLVWQTLALFPFLNVFKNVEFGLKMRGVDAATRRKKALDWLTRLEIAEFAGTNNIVSGSVEAVSADHITIATDIGVFKASPRAGHELGEGTPIDFVVSADRAVLGTAPVEGVNNVRCALISEEFIGSVVTLHLETEDGSGFRVQKQQRELDTLDLSAGTMWASWGIEETYILPSQ